MPPSVSVVPALLTEHVRPVQVGWVNVTVGGLLPAGSAAVVTPSVTRCAAAWPHLSSTRRVTV